MRAAVLAPLFFIAGSACGHDDAPASAACPETELVVAASDYQSSVLCGAPGCVEGPKTTGKTLGADPMLASSNGKDFLLVRDDNAFLELDPACGTAQRIVGLSTLAPAGAQTNPHDIAVADDGTRFVALYDVPKLAFVKPDGTLDGALDLSKYDADGNPQADSIAIVGGKAFVALERLDDHDGLKSKQTSQMLRVDVATRTAEATIDLAGRNPFNAMAIANGALYLAEPGSADVANEPLAGVERFDTATSTTELLVKEQDLGASVVEVAVNGACGVALVAGPVPTVNPTALVSFDATTGAVLHSYASPLFGPTPGYDLQGLAWRGSTLFVGDRRSGPGGYTVHELALGGACDLTLTDQTILLPSPPVALVPTP